MATQKAAQLGQLPIGKLLLQQSVPASIGILAMSINILVDTIFVGQWIGADAIAAINVVLPVSFFIGALGMAIGIGGGSIISRALGKGNAEKARHTFGNQLTLTLLLCLSFVLGGLYFSDSLIPLFGGQGRLFPLAKTYYVIVLYGVPVLGFCMMGNNVVRAEGKPKYSMYAMLLPSISNLLMDVIFIKGMGWGMTGAAWATTLSYGVCASYLLYFFIRQSELKIHWEQLLLKATIVREIGSLGMVTLARQAVVSLVVLIVNNLLFDYGGEAQLAVYAIISRMLMFALFPVLGITQGFLPIAGFNYGAHNKERVIALIRLTLIVVTVMASLVFGLIFSFAAPITQLFTTDHEVITQTPSALRWVFAATPILGIQLIGAAYFQAIGKAIPALLLTLTRQGFFFIPLVFVLPAYFGIDGIWMAFPMGEALATLITAFFLFRELKKYQSSEVPEA
ncbi:MAG: MATE family efflux transporter [Flavobacteriaceae bacterium]